MAIPWLVVLQSVPWTDVIRNAPKVADGAKKLWNTVNRKTPAQESPTEAVKGVADILISFTGEIQLEIIPFASVYESWKVI